MEYSPNVAAAAQGSSPLTSSLFSDATTIEQYVAVVPPDKVILGTPLFGEDWPTNGNSLDAAATGADATLTDSEIEARGSPVYWDSVTDSAWTAYQSGDQWHETFFDDPTSLYQIEQLASNAGLRGVGIWALGMDGTSTRMLDALEGIAPAIQYATPSPLTSPTTTTTLTGGSGSPPSVTSPNDPGQTPSGVSGTSGVPGNGSGPTSSPIMPAITATFDPLVHVAGNNVSPTSLQLSTTTESVDLCVITGSVSPNGACVVSSTPSTDSTAGGSSTPPPPFAGATVAGVLSGLAVANDPDLTCLEDQSQANEPGAPPTILAQPELLVWQVPGDQSYLFVAVANASATSTTAGCPATILAFTNPAQPPTIATGTEAATS